VVFLRVEKKGREKGYCGNKPAFKMAPSCNFLVFMPFCRFFPHCVRVICVIDMDSHRIWKNREHVISEVILKDMVASDLLSLLDSTLGKVATIS
jgi:hypothetical protein